MATFHPQLLVFVFLLVWASAAVSSNPFTAKAALLRYWSRKTPKSPPYYRPNFIASKLSPLSAVDSATYSSLAATVPVGLSARLPSFCAAAHLLCNPSLTPSQITYCGAMCCYFLDPQCSSNPDCCFLSNFTGNGKNALNNVESFTSYPRDFRDPSTFSEDPQNGTNFNSYATDALTSTVGFTAYGPIYKTVNDSFKGYGKGATALNVTFKSYNTDNVTFKGYAKSGDRFKSYNKTSLVDDHNAVTKPKWVVEPGMFFRECSLKKGTVIPMPDIRDKMPPRSFLPRSISTHFSSINSVLHVFNITPDTAIGKAVVDTMSECRRAPSKGETKTCAMSAEDVIDFAVSVLGDGAVVQSTESARGSGDNVVVGEVRGIDGGRLTKSVSCYQSLFPYLVYYCHSVPKVRLYEVEILTVDTKEKINRGVAICHIDTSDWSVGHGAFMALGSSPGKIEVCHWTFQGDMTWTS